MQGRALTTSSTLISFCKVFLTIHLKPFKSLGTSMLIVLSIAQSLSLKLILCVEQPRIIIADQLIFSYEINSWDFVNSTFDFPSPLSFCRVYPFRINHVC